MKCKDCESKGCPYRNTFNNGICVYNPEKSTFDWESFRAEAAKDILCAIISQPNIGYYGDEVENAVIFADKLISKLKEKEKNEN